MTSNPEEASANLREQLLLLATKGALAKRGDRHVVDYEQFLDLLFEVGQKLQVEQEEEFPTNLALHFKNLPCRQACYLLAITYYRPLAYSDR